MTKSFVLVNEVKYYPVSLAKIKLIGLNKFNIFLQLSNRILLLNDSRNVSHANLLNSQKIETVYLKESEIALYTKELIKYNQKHLNPETIKQVSVLAENTELTLNLLQREGLSSENFELINQLAKNIVNISLNNSLIDFLKTLQQGNIKYYLARTLISKLICHKMNWHSETTLYKITLASLLCDLGESSAGEKFHGEKTALELEKLKVSSDIYQAILHHHENNDGSGPLKIKKHKIHPIARIIRVADFFTDGLINEKVSKIDLINKIKENSPKLFDSDVTKGLIKLFPN